MDEMTSGTDTMDRVAEIELGRNPGLQGGTETETCSPNSTDCCAAQYWSMKHVVISVMHRSSPEKRH